MEFEITLTTGQEGFRKEVQAWLEANARMPAALGKMPLENKDVTRAQWQWGNQFTRKLGAKGWLAPTLPKEYGGGGLSVDQASILQEEMARHDVSGGQLPHVVGPLIIHGTEEQKRELLAPMLRGEWRVWQLWTEPEAGSDLASLKTQAVRDGDDFIVTGTKIFISGTFEPDYMYVLAVTDPNAPRHQNMGAFCFPATLPGISWTVQDLITREGQNLIHLDGVRVSRRYLIGEETSGWRVNQSAAETEHGARGAIVSRDTLIPDLIQYCKETLRNGQPLSKDPDIQGHLVQAYIDENVIRLLGLRNYWMFNHHQPMTYHGTQYRAVRRDLATRTASDVLAVLGPYALCTDQEHGLLEKRAELQQRWSIRAQHGGGTSDVDRVMIARRLGMSRTRERAGVTY
ncbi:MAG: hypothetical protein HW388_362 [Dehalococcoidia bacterium]|nr:hypothetical protein [Dehalococcoidia bacterium]